MKKLATFSVLAALACSPVSADEVKPELTLAYNSDLSSKIVIPSSHRIEKQASEQDMENLNKAMDKLNSKLNNELEDKLAKSLRLNLQ